MRGRTVRDIDGVRAMDAFEFARAGGEISGEVALAALSRFVEGLPEQAGGAAGLLQWSARGEQGVHGKFFLHLHVRAAPVVLCQRCLTPFALPVDSRVTLELVRSESDLGSDGLGSDALGSEDDLDAPEKVLGSRRFDLLAHVEDELILTVPTIARHGVCPDLPQALQQQEFAVQARPASPFAVLEMLKDKQ